ncbi:hypothetical protein B0T19DRAFT_214816 [Cercophora scortea]|uniref:Uncharacterized protein n=1 Tax=Cercophora scortea TaxID=314031 RepID=A0AAE0M8Y4_9PEZI|nr:hypothetical protein B0T19DRAFT_214816 [Cercophora scortea]
MALRAAASWVGSGLHEVLATPSIHSIHHHSIAKSWRSLRAKLQLHYFTTIRSQGYPSITFYYELIFLIRCCRVFNPPHQKDSVIPEYMRCKTCHLINYPQINYHSLQF